MPLFTLLPFYETLREMWQEDGLGKFMVIAIAIIVAVGAGLIVALIYVIIVAIVAKIRWYRNRQPCTHCNTWTLENSDGTFQQCPEDQPCCSDCQHQHEMDAEQKIKCPMSACEGTTMEKVTIDGVLIMDRCPRCEAVLLDHPQELARIKQLAYDHGYTDGQALGHSSGFNSGVVIGTVIN